MVGIFKQYLGSDNYTTIENPEILRGTRLSLQTK